MNPRIQKKFAKLEEQKERLLSDISKLPAKRLRFRPNPKTWSILEILDHLVKVEDSIMNMVRQNLPDGNQVSPIDRLGAVMVTSMMKTTIRVKVPAQATMVLPQDVDGLAEIETRWNLTRTEMSRLLSSLQNEQLKCGLFRHPVGGWMTMAQTLGFISAHLKHHVFQINRVSAAGRDA